MTGVQNKNRPVGSVCVSARIHTNGIITVSRWIMNNFYCYNWQQTPLFMKSIPGVLQRLWTSLTTLANTSSMHIFLGLYLKGKSCLCSWHQCSRAWQCRRVKSRPSWTYGWRGRILRTRNRLITVCGLMWPPWLPIYTRLSLYLVAFVH